MNPFKTKIGTVTFDDPYEDDYEYESAGWATTYALEPGTYDAYMVVRGQGANEKISFETESIKGAITYSYKPIGVEMPEGYDGEDEIGDSVSEVMKINPNDVKNGTVRLNLEVPYIKLIERGFLPTIDIDREHEAFKSVQNNLDNFKFKNLLASVDPRLMDYAKKHGFLEGENLAKGMDMGTLKYGTIIRYDNHLRAKLGGGLSEFGVSFDKVDEAMKGKWGDLEGIFERMTMDLKRDHDFSKPKKEFFSFTNR